MHPDTWYQLFGSPIMLDAVWCTPTHGINYSVLPSCWMPFGAPQHMVSIIWFSHHVGCHLVHPNTWYQLFGSPIMLDNVWCTPTRGINYSVSLYVGCRLVHPNTWYQLFGLPSCWMPFGAPQHVVSIIRFSHHVGCRLVHPNTWYQLFGSPIMSDAVWCIPTSGINYSVLPSCRMPFRASRHVVSIIRFSHHVGCRFVHPDTWYQLFGSPIMSDAVSCIPTSGINYSVLPSCRMPFRASRHVVSIIRFSHHVGCRFVHPDTWYQLFGSPIMSDAVWCIPTRGIN